jgi:LemA protein
MTALIVVVVIVVLVLIAAVLVYNSVVAARNKVDEGWAQISVQLKRRHDLIPNLVTTVKGYATHESGTLEAVIKARNVAVESEDSPAAAAQAENQLTQALGKLFALSESYPDLKASQNFVKLQDELVGTEDRIAFARQYYNDVVRQWNTKIETIPFNIVASSMNAERRVYFEIDDIDASRYREAMSADDTSKPPDVSF